MDQEEFAGFLRGRKLPEEQIPAAIALAERFEAFLEQGSPPAVEQVRAFSRMLIAEGTNTYDNYVTLARAGRYLGRNDVYVAVVELLDGSEAMENLHKKLGRAVGRKRRDQVFEGIPLPPLGTPTTDLPRTTAAVLERMEAGVDSETCKQVLSSGLRNLESRWFVGERKKYRRSGGIDAYLALKREEFIAELERLLAEGKPFFTQPITAEVIEYVRSQPEMEGGVRVGSILYHTKIPHMTREYMAETDPQRKRYYYCHCPWVKESLQGGEVAVSPAFCQCSAAFVRKPWEVIYGQPLQADVLETVLTGSLRCRFAIHLPPEEMPEAVERRKD